eukprot:gene3168-3638_t
MASRVSPFNIQDENILDGEFVTFCNNLETIRKKFLEEWIANWKESSEQKIAKQYETAITECGDDIKKLEERKQAQELRCFQMKSVGQQLENLKTEMDAMKDKCIDKEKKLKDLSNKIDSESTDVNALEKVTAAKKEKIAKAINFFKQRLGLHFQNIKGEEQIKVILTNIDVCDSDKQFSFNTKVIESRYQITGCDPCITELDELVQELNMTNNFSKFVIKMRHAFKHNLKEANENIPPS